MIGCFGVAVALLLYLAYQGRLPMRVGMTILLPACAMAAHVIYRAIDRDAPATASRTVIDEVIRGMIRFDGDSYRRTHALME